MRATLITLLLASMALSIPHGDTAAIEIVPQQKDNCAAFPWYIDPQMDMACNDDGIPIKPNSGPSSNPRSAHCELLDPSGMQTFQYVDVTIACGGWKVSLFPASDTKCKTKGTATTKTEQCMVAKNNGTAAFMRFSAVRA